MTKVTAKGQAKIDDVKGGFQPKLSGSVTLVKALENGVQVKGVITDKSVQTNSLTGCTLTVEKPGSMTGVYSFDSKTTKITVFQKTRFQDKDIRAKVCYDQKGERWTGEATMDLAKDKKITAAYDFKTQEATLTGGLNLSGIDLKPKYNVTTKAASIKASKKIEGVPVTASYDVNSKKIGLEAEVKPATLMLTTTPGGATTLGVKVGAQRSFNL